MRLKNVKGAKEKIESSSYLLLNPEEYKGHFHDVFENEHPLHIEIGMGKGNFIIENAKRYPEINFIGIEKFDSVIVRAIDKLQDIDLPNLRLIRMDASHIENVFDHEVDTIYLNFSDPWPKKRCASRRLTSEVFLDIYDELFKDKKTIIMKTDNLGLFASSIITLSNHGYIFTEVNMDLHHSDIPSVYTEYEKKFKELGVKINYLKAVK